MAETHPKSGPREFVIKQLERLIQEGYADKSVEACLKAIEQPVRQLRMGDALWKALEERVRAHKADEAITMLKATGAWNKLFPAIALGMIALFIVAAVISFLSH